MPPVPTISVVIPSYNSGVYLRQAVASVLAQKGDNFILKDIIIANDRSTDPVSCAVLEEVSRLPKVRVLLSEGRKGCPGARNFAIQASDADWIVLLDADDAFLDDAMALRMAALAAHPDATWIGGDFIYCDAELRPSERPFYATRAHTRAILYGDAAAMVRLPRPIATFANINLAMPSAVMIRRDRLVALGLFDETLAKAEDIDMWLRLAQTEDYVFVRAPVTYYRVHGGSMTQVEPSRAWKIKIYEKYLSDPAMGEHHAMLRQRIANFLMEEARLFRHTRDIGKLATVLGRSLRYAPACPQAPITVLRQLLAAVLTR